MIEAAGPQELPAGNGRVPVDDLRAGLDVILVDPANQVRVLFGGQRARKAVLHFNSEPLQFNADIPVEDDHVAVRQPLRIRRR